MWINRSNLLLPFVSTLSWNIVCRERHWLTSNTSVSPWWELTLVLHVLAKDLWGLLIEFLRALGRDGADAAGVDIRGVSDGAVHSSTPAACGKVRLGSHPTQTIQSFTSVNIDASVRPKMIQLDASKGSRRWGHIGWSVSLVSVGMLYMASGVRSSKLVWHGEKPNPKQAQFMVLWWYFTKKTH